MTQDTSPPPPKRVTVWMLTSFLEELETEWYDDEETKEEFLNRVRMGVQEGSFSHRITLSGGVDKIDIAEEPKNYIAQLNFWVREQPHG